MITGNIANLNIQAGNCFRLYLFVLESRGKERIPKHLQILALISDSMLHVIYLLCLKGELSNASFQKRLRFVPTRGGGSDLDHTQSLFLFCTTIKLARLCLTKTNFFEEKNIAFNN